MSQGLIGDRCGSAAVDTRDLRSVAQGNGGLKVDYPKRLKDLER
jgi:hypothetical protein